MGLDLIYGPQFESAGQLVSRWERDLPPELANPVLSGPVPPGTTVSILGNRVSGTIARLDPGVTVAFTYTANIAPSAPIHLRVCVGPLLMDRRIKPGLSRFQEAHPHIELEFVP